MGTKWIRICTYVPPEMKELIDKRVKELAHSGTSDYLRSLIREDLLKAGYYKKEK